jgi:hypothetical protein
MKLFPGKEYWTPRLTLKMYFWEYVLWVVVALVFFCGRYFFGLF